MGFRIRDKSLFWTKSGWKNNWEPKILNMPRALNPSQTMFLTSRYDHHSFLRCNLLTIQWYNHIETILEFASNIYMEIPRQLTH
jgi:hypothetical protein